MSKGPSAQKSLSAQQTTDLLQVLETRFEENRERHPGIDWQEVQARLEADPGKCWSLNEMERTGGEPDVIDQDQASGQFIFCDCSQESPQGRRGLCYDQAAMESRKKNKPKGSALGLAAAMGIELLTEDQYRKLQELGNFDTKTSSWVITPEEIRDLGGALFCDHRYDHVFTYHNGAESYYAARGFRGTLRI